MQRMTALFSAVLLSAGMISAPAMAQESSAATEQGATTQQSQAATATAQDFSDQQLQQFADASQEIAVISQDYSERLQGEKDQAKQQEIRMEANEKMVAVVEESGLDVETFNAIGQAIQQDPELMKRVQAMAKNGS